MGGETILFAGGHYEVTNPGSEQQVTKYYFAGMNRIATPALAPGASVRKYTIPQSMSVEYLLGDHLGSTSLTTDANGTKVSEMRYKPWGEVRSWWTAGLSTTPAYTLPEYSFTGQYSHMDDPSTAAVTEGFGLMFYVSRMYDPALGRFAQADTVVPGGVQGLDRYAYVNNDPVRYTDPSGHSLMEDEFGGGCSTSGYCSGSSGSTTITTMIPSGSDGRGGRNSGEEGEVITDNPPNYPDPTLTIPPMDGVCPEGYTLVQCAYIGGYYYPYDDITMDNDEFNKLILAIFFDIKHREPVGGYDFADRSVYDTPLWDAYGKFTGKVCFDNICYKRSEVNYVAQGMWVAASGQSNSEGRLGVVAWKLLSFTSKPLTYFPPVPSEGTLIWFDRGYYNYNALNSSYPYSSP